MFTSTFSRLPFTVFAPDTGAGSGGSGAADPKPQEGDPNGEPGAPDNPAPAPAAGDEKDPATLDAEALKKELEQTRKEAASYRTKLRKLEESAQAADEAKLAEQQKWQELAEKREARIKELEPLQDRLAAYETRETERIAATVKDWPDSLRKLVERASNLEDKQAVLESLKPTVEALAKSPAAPGSGPGPKPAGDPKAKVTPSRPVRL